MVGLCSPNFSRLFANWWACGPLTFRGPWVGFCLPISGRLLDVQFADSVDVRSPIVGRLFADYWPFAGRLVSLLDVCSLIGGRLFADWWMFVRRFGGRLFADCWPIANIQMSKC